MNHFFEDSQYTPFILEKLKKKKDEYYRLLYSLYRKDFLRQGKLLASHLNNADIEDAFQESIISFMKNLDNIDSKKRIIGYLFVIFRNKLQIKHKFDFYENAEEFEDLLKDLNVPIYRFFYLEHLKNLFSVALEKLNDPCKTLLIMKFYKNFSGEAIAENMGYNSEDVAFVRIRQCLDRLKRITKNNL